TGNAKDSLERRVRAMHALWLEALATMDTLAINTCERPGVLPIAFSVNHQVRLEDGCLYLLGADPPLWSAEGWAQRCKVTVDDIGKDTTVSDMERQQIGDYPEFCEYARCVYARTENWLGALEADRLGDVLFDGAYPEFIAKAFIHRVVRDETVLLVDALECWVYQHGIRHLGEVEHARALVGLGGLTS
ncbi:MAG: hypothetical protein ACYDD6_04120, partial [Acidimicrobiales bacterium]